MNERARRVGENEALFRSINERQEEVAAAFGWLTGRLDIVCECGDRSCIERIALEPEDYRRVRADATLFAVLRGHDNPTVEDVVSEHGTWVVVRKREGGPAELARQTDPRR